MDPCTVGVDFKTSGTEKNDKGDAYTRFPLSLHPAIVKAMFLNNTTLIY